MDYKNVVFESKSNTEKLKRLYPDTKESQNDEKNRTEMLAAIDQRKFARIEELIRKGTNLDNIYGVSGYNVFHILIQRSDYLLPDCREYERLAIMAINHNVNTKARVVSTGEGPLQLAASSKSFKIMKRLIERAVFMKIMNIYLDDFENIVFKLSEWQNTEEMIHILNLIIRSNDLSDDPLNNEFINNRAIVAINTYLLSDHFRHCVFDKMLKMVIDINKYDINGCTILVNTIYSSQEDTEKYSNTKELARNTLCNSRCNDKHYHKSDYNLSESLVPLLWYRGADIQKPTAKGILPLYAASTLTNDKVTKLLIELGADIHGQNNDGKYAIHAACSNRSLKNLRYLLTVGASVNVTDEYGQYPIHVACANMSRTIIDILLNLGNDITATDVYGNSPISRIKKPLLLGSVTSLITQFALVQISTGYANENDLEMIKRDPELFNIYEKSYNALQKLKNIEALKFLVTDARILLKYWKNTAFAKTIEKAANDLLQISKHYALKVIVVQEMCDKLRYTEKDILRYLPAEFPTVIIEKIAYYMLDDYFRHFEINTYFYRPI